jgi:iron complex outermembrane recepter protein
MTKLIKVMNKTGNPKHAVLFIMKVTLLQILLTLSFVSYTFAKKVNGQEILNKKVSLNLTAREMKSVLKTIASSAGVGFTYNSNILPSKKKISVIANNERLGDLLSRILGPFDISYEVIGNQIVLKKNEDPLVSLKNTNPGLQPLKVVEGTVVSADGAPLPGVSVSIEGTSRGTVTDEKGHFQIQANDGEVLVFSSVGYLDLRVTVGASSNIHISLRKSDNAMGEVVVTALGIKREARSLGYSVQKVDGSDVIKADPPNIANGLIGKAAGLNITVPNGVEGSSTRIVIRGNNSLFGNNQPLIVVDGVTVDNEPILPQGQSFSTNGLLDAGSVGGSRDVSQPGVDYGSFLNTINADDVESINVLKGPTAAALYGARGANGVILITTKKGNKQNGLGINYNFSDRWNMPYRYMQLQHEYGSGMTETLYSATPAFNQDASGNNREFTEGDQYGAHQDLPGTTIPFYNVIGFPGDGASWGPKMAGQPLVWWDGTTRPYTANPNIFKSFYKNGSTTTHNISFSGGGDIGTVRASYTRTANDAITYNSNYTQNVFNVGSSINISKKVKAEVTASYTNLNRLNAPDIFSENGTNNSVLSNSGVGYITTYHLPADYKPLERSLTFNPDGSFNKNLVSGNSPYPSSSVGNYWWNTLDNQTIFTQNQLLGSIKLSGDILPWLNATGHVGEDYLTNQFETRAKPYDPAGVDGLYSNDLATVSIQNFDGMLTAHKDDLFKDFDASFAVGASNYHYKLYDLANRNPGPFNYPFTYNITNYAGTNPFPMPTENRFESELNSVYGLLNLSYKKYLFLEVSGRNDWSSTLPASKLSFFYPSASLSWVFTDALKMQSASSWLSYGKLRLAAASSANGYVPYQTVFTYSPVTHGGFTTGLSVPSTLPSLSIQPQQSRSFEIGTDLSFLNNRVNFNFTYYDIYSYDQILPVPVATSSGADQLTINTGALRNRGIEFIVNAKIISSKNFTWDITVNGAHNRNRVVSLAPGIDQLPLGSWFSGDGSSGGGDGVNMNARVGDDYGTIYGYDYLYNNGQKVVNLWYADGMNTGNGAVIGAQYATTPGFVKLGDATPKLTGGIGNTVSYKSFSFYVLTDFKIGGQIWSGDYATIMGQGEAPETVKERDGHGLPYTFPDGTTGNVGVILQGVTPDGKPNTAVVNSWWKYAGNYQSWDNVPIVRTNSIFTNSWGKLRELNLTYRLPNSLVSKTGIFQSLSVSIIGRDLFYLFTTLPDHINPESLSGTTNVQGIQFGALPSVRSFGFSVKAGF